MFEWLGGAATGKDGIEKAIKFQPDIVLIDYFLPEKNGVEIGIDILKVCPKTKLILLTMEDSPWIIKKAIENEFSAWISKASEKVELLSKLEQVGASQAKFFPELSHKEAVPTPGAYNFDQLTKREKEILLLISQGFTSQNIADKLFLSLLTVNTHRRNLLNKLGIKNFAQLSSGTGLGDLMK